MERPVALVKAYKVGKGTLLVAIPREVRRELKLGAGDRFFVKVDDRGRIIYERVE